MHQVGIGALGPVYRARLSHGDPAGRGRLFAVKAFHVDLTPEQTIVFGTALQDVVDAGAPHAAVANPAGAGVADGVPYLAYEYVEAESLDVRARPRAAPAAEVALPRIVQIAEALDAAHGQGLVHGALHPRDVLVAAEKVRVGGFGVVTALGRVGRRGPLRRPYAAPEQIAGGDWGPSADRYALAAVACELLTGRRAAPAGARLAGDLGRIADADAAPRLVRLFEAALAADPGRRPASAGRFVDDLAGALGWTGAAGVRVGSAAPGVGDGRESGGGRKPDRVTDDAAVAAGGADPAGGEPAAAAGGGKVMRKRRKRTPKDTEAGWTEPALDLDAPDDEAPLGDGDPPAGEAPLIVDAAPGPSGPEGPGVDPLDALGDGGGAGYDADDLTLRTSPDPLAEVAAGLDAGLRDGRDRADSDEDPAEDPAADVADGYAPISVGDLEARVDDVGDDVPVSEAADEAPADDLPPPGVSGDGLSEYDGYGQEVSGQDYEAGDVPVGGGVDLGPDEPVRGGPEAQEAAAAVPGEDDDEFALTPEEDGYDYAPEDDAEPEDAAADIFDSASVEPARRPPIALVAVIGVAVAATAFVIGLGWMGGGEGGPVAEDAAEAAPAEDAARAFSEAVVGESSSAAERDGGIENAAPPPDPAPASPSVAPPPDPAPPASPAIREPDPAPAAVPEPDPPPSSAPPAVPEPDPPPPPPDVPATAPAVGRLLVRSMPPGAEVVVNGDPRGTTPMALTELPYGTYEVEVSLAGYGSRRVQIVLDEGDPIGSFSADLTAEPAEPSAARPAPGGSPPGRQVAIGSVFADARPPGVAFPVARPPVGEADPDMLSSLDDAVR